MNEAWSDAMKTIALASSSERPRRPIGTPVTRAALFSGVPVKRVNMPVSVGPGATPFTRIPDLAISRHRLGDAFDGVLAADIAPFLAKATAAARPMPLNAPVIKTTGLLICNPRNLLPYRQSMEADPLAAA